MSSDLRRALVQMTMAITNADGRRLSNPDAFNQAAKALFELRDSILYRFESLAFHHDLVRQREAALFREFEADPLRRDGLDVVRHASRHLTFLFDDIVFGAVSLFDYYGGMIRLLLIGSPRRRPGWLDAMDWATAPVSAGRRTATLMQDLNKEWIRSLADHRSEIIHQRSLLAGGRLSITGSSTTVRFTQSVPAPRSFVERIDHLQVGAPPGGWPLRVVAHWIIGQTYDASLSLANALSEDLGNTIPK